jgi:hypothetical protein
MIKICLDTNTLHDNWLAIGEAFTLLGELIAKGGCKAYVSEISVLEHVRHYEKDAPQIESKLRAQLGSYSKMFVEGFKALSLPTIYDTKAFEKHFRERMKSLGIQILCIPNALHADLVDRDLADKKPFAASGKGYRDALTWLSFLGALDGSTTRAVFVTQDANDFANQDKSALHPDLAGEIKTKSPQCESFWFPTPQKLADEVIKARLKEINEQAAEAAKTEKLLKRIQTGKYKRFNLEDVVIDGLEHFEAQEPEGAFYAGDVSLEEPLYVTSIESPEEIEATSLYKLQSGNYLCEGTANVRATVEGFLDKFEAFNQSQEGHAFVSTPHWNDHYSEVEVTDVSAQINFSFEFEKSSSEILKFEITKVASIQ